MARQDHPRAVVYAGRTRISIPLVWFDFGRVYNTGPQSRGEDPEVPVAVPCHHGECMTLSWIRTLAERVNQWAEGQVAGRFPFARMTLWGLFVAFVLTTFPNYPRLIYDKKLDEDWGPGRPSSKSGTTYSRICCLRITYGSHDANMTFRILVPAIARLFGLGKVGVFVFQSLCGVALLWAVGRVCAQSHRGPRHGAVRDLRGGLDVGGHHELHRDARDVRRRGAPAPRPSRPSWKSPCSRRSRSSFAPGPMSEDWSRRLSYTSTM